MTTTGDKRHTELIRPYGTFGRNEWAFVGGRCSLTKALADNLIKALSPLYKCSYLDSLHPDQVQPLPGRIASGAFSEYIDNINYKQLNYLSDLNNYQLRLRFTESDIVFTNGNHHPASAQVAVINEKKRASLLKRMHQLTNVKLILLDGVSDVFDFVKEQLPDWKSIPIIKHNDTARIISFFEDEMQQREPKLNGLVLAGGKSTRMGQDKTVISWHGKEQHYHLADLLKTQCDEVFISCRADQQDTINSEYKTLPDTFTDLGPFGAILSAFRQHPDRAWLVVASDLPLMDEATLKFLNQRRHVSSNATAFRSPETGFPEPLIAIWEPKSYPALLWFLAQGYSCPRKVLINSDTFLLHAPDEDVLINVNTPEDADRVKKILEQKSEENG